MHYYNSSQGPPVKWEYAARSQELHELGHTRLINIWRLHHPEAYTNPVLTKVELVNAILRAEAEKIERVEREQQAEVKRA